MQKFTKQLPKDDLKKFAKEVSKKLVASDFKNNRVDDPTKITDKQEKKVKQFVREFFEKAVEKKKALDKKKADKLAVNGAGSNGTKVINGSAKLVVEEDNGQESDAEDAIDLTPSSIPPTPSTSEQHKRKRSDAGDVDTTPGGDGSESSKRLKEEDAPTPPPPPPPPSEGIPLTLDTENGGLESPIVENGTGPVSAFGIVMIRTGEGKEELSKEDEELKRQEEDLMRENEEAVLMEKGVVNGNGNGNGVKHSPKDETMLDVKDEVRDVDMDMVR